MTGPVVTLTMPAKADYLILARLALAGISRAVAIEARDAQLPPQLLSMLARGPLPLLPPIAYTQVSRKETVVTARYLRGVARLAVVLQ